MEKTKKRLINIIAIIFIMIILLLSLYIYINKDNDNNKTENNNMIVAENIENKKEISEQKYYNVVALVKQYYSMINKENYMMRDGTDESNEEYVREGIYGILSKEYIFNNNITINNIYDHIKLQTENNTFVPISMKLKINDTLETYLIYGDLINLINHNFEKKYFIVNLDTTNKTFSVEPIIKDYNSIEEIEFKCINQPIKQNNSNKYDDIKYKEDQIIRFKFSDFKNMILTKSEDAYNLFNKEYRTKKFGNYEGFKQYVENNYENLKKMTVKEYQVVDNGKKYICIDNKGKYSIFINKENSQQEVIWDIYTINLPEFKEKYDKVNEEKKVGLNIEKIFEAINDKDYKYVYDKLDKNFRKNKIPTQEDFEEMIKNRLFDNNKIEHSNVTKKSNTYVYDIIVSDDDNKNSTSRKVEMTIIMMLKDNYDFVMSFSFND